MRLLCCGSNAMNLLRVIATVNPESGGPIQGILASAGVLKEQGCTQEIVSLDSPLDPWARGMPFPLHPMGIRDPLYRAWRKKIPWLRYGYTPHLVPWLKENATRFDAIVVHGLWNYVALGSRRALAKCQTPYFVYPHGMLDPYFNEAHPLKAIAKQILWWLSEGRLIAKARTVFFTSEEEQRLARRSFWPFRCNGRVVPYGTHDIEGNAEAQIASFRASVPQLGGRKFVLFLSRIHPKKGCDLLIQAFAGAAARDPELDLVIAGPDSMGFGRKLRSLAADLRIAERIHWPGLLAGERKWGALRGAEAFILPSHQENFGIVLAEAMACGTPILTTFKVNVWRDVEEGGAGLVGNDDLTGVAGLLDRFLALPAAEKKAMGRRARQAFEARFDLGKSGQELIRALSGDQP